MSCTTMDLWSRVEEAEPDEIDLQMLLEIKADSDCNNFVKQSGIDYYS